MITTIPRTPALDSPRRPALDRPTAMTLAETAYQRFLAQLRDLSDDDWPRPTDCPAWDVRALASHVLAQAEMAASVREGVLQAAPGRSASAGRRSNSTPSSSAGSSPAAGAAPAC